MPTEETKQCPYCAETIKAAAVVRRFCGRDLVAPASSFRAPAPKLASAPPPKRGCLGRVLRWIAWAVGGFIVLGIVINTVRYTGERVGIFPTRTPTRTPTATLTPTLTPAPTNTPLPTATPLPTDTPTITDTPLPTDTPTITPTPSDTPLPTNTPTSTPTPSSEQKISAAIDARNRDVRPAIAVAIADGIITVQWAINDNFSSSWIKSGAMSDAADILRAIHGLGLDYQLINLTGTFAMVDKFGNKSESPVLWLSISKETMDKINWDDKDFVGVLFQNHLLDIADSLKFHPAFDQ